MTNADKFKNIFGLYATELWSMPEKDFLKWLNSEVMNCSEIPNNWILCSERLPEDYEEVLVWFEYFRYGNYNCLYQMYGIGSYSSGYNSWLINQETGWNELKVFAWMPLPKPPKVVNVPTAGREWLHDLLQDAIDDGIITETQASRLMDRIAEGDT